MTGINSTGRGKYKRSPETLKKSSESHIKFYQTELGKQLAQEMVVYLNSTVGKERMLEGRKHKKFSSEETTLQKIDRQIKEHSEFISW